MPTATKRKRTTAPKRDINAEVTQKMLDELAKGTVPWRKPWTVGVPRSMSTGKPYRGINTFLLSLGCHTSNWWGTYKQVQERTGMIWDALANNGLGGFTKPDGDDRPRGIRKGSKATLIVYWKTGLRDAKDTEDGDDNGKVRWATLKYFNVFNADQADWPDGLPTRMQPPEANDFDPIDDAEAIFTGYMDRPDGPSHQFGGDRACYSPSFDQIMLPVLNTFDRAEAFYSTAFHEMGHSTGHKSRLKREGIVENHFFGDDFYAFEELVAEMSAAMLCAHAGIEQVQLANSASYLAHWLGVLGGDSKLIVKAAAAAQRACDLILATFDDDDDTDTDTNEGTT